MLGRIVILSGLLLGTGLATGQVLQHKRATQPTAVGSSSISVSLKAAPTTDRALQQVPASELAGGVFCQAFFTKSSFAEFVCDNGKVLKGIEDFEESNVKNGVKIALPAPLEGNVPNVDALGMGFPTGLTEMNILIQDNITPEESPAFPNPSGNPQALYVVGTGFIESNSKKVGEDLEVLFGIEASLDLIFSGADKSGVGFELSHFEGFGGGTSSWIVAVYDTKGDLIGKFDVPEAVEPAKSFFGIWCDLPIGRINIWDFGIIPDAIDNIQMYVDQPDQQPACPWDCGIPRDKTVGIVDFLALLSQWGGAGPCDFDCGGVGITDFLVLLGQWGPCPAPINDECAGKIIIDRFDSGGTLEEHFDMYAATPSPDPFLCTGIDPNPFKDIWYCLQNNSNEEKIVTLTGSVDLLAEVTAGCDCANPGPLVTCGRLVAAAATTFTMQAGEQVCIRLLNDVGLPNDQIKGNLIITNEPVPPPDDLNFYVDPILFFEALQLAGKTEKFIWNFKPDFAPPNVLIGVTSPLDINTHFVNAPGVWFEGEENLWPPEVDNVQFAANLNPQGPFKPGQFLLYVKAGPDVLLDNNAVMARIDPKGLDTSLTIFSGPPDPIDDNHTAMQLEVVSLGKPDQVADIHVTVYDKADVEIGKAVLTLEAGQKQFIAFITKDPAVTIGRVDIWDVFGSEEGISAIATYNQQDPPGDCPGLGDCCVSNGTPGCDNAECCDLICAADAFCCSNTWDGICADAAIAMCEACGGGGLVPLPGVGRPR